MQYEFVSIHELLGIARGDGNFRLELTLPDESSSAFLTDDIENDIAELELRTAVANTILRRFVGQGRETPRLEAVAAEQQRLADARRQARVNAVYLVYRGRGTVRDVEPQAESDWGAFHVSMHRDTESVAPIHRPRVTSVLTALTLVHERLWNARTVAEGTVFRRDSLPVFAFTLSAQGEAYVSSPIQQSTVTSVDVYVQIISSHPMLSQAALLLAGSMRDGSDGLESFVLAWAALESFVKGSYLELEGNKRNGLRTQFQRVAQELASADEVRTDIVTFNRIYSMRNALYHAGDMHAAYPTRDTQVLLREYLVRYANNGAPRNGRTGHSTTDSRNDVPGPP